MKSMVQPLAQASSGVILMTEIKSILFVHQYSLSHTRSSNTTDKRKSSK